MDNYKVSAYVGDANIGIVDTEAEAETAIANWLADKYVKAGAVLWADLEQGQNDRSGRVLVARNATEADSFRVIDVRHERVNYLVKSQSAVNFKRGKKEVKGVSDG